MLLIYGKNGVRTQYTPQDKDKILPVLIGKIEGDVDYYEIYVALHMLNGAANEFDNFHVNKMMEGLKK